MNMKFFFCCIRIFLKDISHDTDTILDKMEEKDMGGFDSGMLTGLMANKGSTPASSL